MTGVDTKMVEDPARQKTAVQLRFNEMQQLFDLSEKETNLLVAIFLCQTRCAEYGDFGLGRYNSGEKISALARLLGILDVEAAELLDDNGNIKKFGQIDEDMDLDRTFLSYLSGINSKPLAERFWTKFEGEALPWHFHGKVTEQHGTVLKKMILAKKPDSGVSCLLYGVCGSGKTSFCTSLAADLGRDIYFIAQNDDNERRMTYSPAFRYAALAVAQKQLDPAKSLLVVDEADKMLENVNFGGGLFARFFGGDVPGSRDGESKGQLNTVLDNNKHTIFFVCNSKQESIDLSSRRWFDYNIFFDNLTAYARSFIWKNTLEFNHCKGKLTEDFIARLSVRYPVNPGGISVAVRNAAAVCAKDPELDFAQEVMTFLKAHCQLLNIQESPEEKNDPTRHYSLEGLNIRSGIKLPRLIEAGKNFLKNCASMAANDQKLGILCFGCPGSGKSEFAKYLAKQLDKKLLIKNASDLLNAYVGGTEQRIAAAFAEAEISGDILCIEGGDSLLSSREGAHRNWEVSQVNTFLSELDRFRGIVIVSTNLIHRLDPAALRRFSFRLHFDYLLPEGKEIFFQTYFGKQLGLPELNEVERERLFAIEQMTPADFRNVRQQFFFLQDSDLSNMEIIEALETEIASKSSHSTYKGLGSVAQKMEFGA